jgi:antitoxin component of MazEF toxin-antitoxin module
MITKTRKQGNSIMLTVPKDFNVPNGVEVEAKLVENGILYEFVEPQKEFYDFSEDILSDIIAEGYDKDEILVEFKNRKTKCILPLEILLKIHLLILKSND